MSQSLSPALANQTYVLTQRGRRVRALLLVALVVALFTALGNNIVFANEAKSVEHVVAAHETLWDIAAGISPDQDVRKSVWQIQQLNHMSDASIEVGQVLLLPAN